MCGLLLILWGDNECVLEFGNEVVVGNGMRNDLHACLLHLLWLVITLISGYLF
jgi:hypothetical protein